MTSEHYATCIVSRVYAHGTKMVVDLTRTLRYEVSMFMHTAPMQVRGGFFFPHWYIESTSLVCVQPSCRCRLQDACKVYLGDRPLYRQDCHTRHAWLTLWAGPEQGGVVVVVPSGHWTYIPLSHKHRLLNNTLTTRRPATLRAQH